MYLVELLPIALLLAVGVAEVLGRLARFRAEMRVLRRMADLGSLDARFDGREAQELLDGGQEVLRPVGERSLRPYVQAPGLK